MLGALEIRAEDGRDVGVGGARLRALLILLALEPGRVVSSELLIDGIWEQDPPAAAANALQALVSRLRRALPGVDVESHPAGYRLLVRPEDVDVVRFERLASEGHAALAGGDPGTAARVLREALALWRGQAPAGRGGLRLLPAAGDPPGGAADGRPGGPDRGRSTDGTRPGTDR